MSASLRLDRMLVTRGSHVLYDEAFHAGVNIIHGSNGSGKSTLADFIFFGLGGDLRDWRESAERAEAVTLGITTPAGPVTLRRYPSTDAMRPMELFFGSFDVALNGPKSQWQTLSYKRPDRGYSFSQVLFRAIGLPEAVSDGASNITMHQVLRLLYIDQLTPVQRIFRAENFDTWQTRLAVGDMLAGVGGYDLFDRQLDLRETKKRFDEAKRDYTSLVAVASGYGENILSEYISTDIQRLIDERSQLLSKVADLSTDTVAYDGELDEIKRVRSEAVKVQKRAKRDAERLEEEIEILDSEASDAETFIEHLQRSIADFDVATVMFSALGRLDFEFCPACFAPISEKAIAHCQLCDTPRVDGEDDSRALAVKLDLQMQLRESEALQADRQLELSTKKAHLRQARVTLRRADASLAVTESGGVTGREAAVADLSRKIGFIDSELEVLQRRLELAKRVADASIRKEDLNARITALETEIEALERSQAERKQRAYSAISRESKNFLDQDLAEHSDFGSVTHVGFSFPDDWVAINGEKNRARSASGMVILKNSFAAAMFKASLLDQKFNLPRWVLFDNIADKGMVEGRSHNFQRLLVKMSQSTAISHQLIFTTSMLAPELEESKYVVGPRYSSQQKTLR